MKLRGSILSLCVMTATAWSDPIPKTPAGRLIEQDRVLVIAHRGDSKAAPENTLPAFESAVRVGSDLVELDYVHTADGTPIVIHDDTLDRTTDADDKWGEKKIRVNTKKLAELAELDAGKWFDPKFEGTRLPTLEESIDLIQKGSATLIERKAGDAKTCVDLLERKEIVQDVVVQAFDWKFLADCRSLRKDLILGALGTGKLSEEKIEEIKETGAQAVGWQFLALREKEIQMLHDAGFKVWAWTVDDEKAAERLIEWGIDGIISNYPAKIKQIVERESTAAR